MDQDVQPHVLTLVDAFINVLRFFTRHWRGYLRGEQKTKKLIKSRKPENKITKKTELWKKPINRLKFWKNRLVRFGFGFIGLKPKNRAKLVWIGFCPKKPNQTETGRFEPVSVWFFFKIGLVFFYIKTESNKKWSPLSYLSSIGLWLACKHRLLFLFFTYLPRLSRFRLHHQHDDSFKNKYYHHKI